MLSSRKLGAAWLPSPRPSTWSVRFAAWAAVAWAAALLLDQLTKAVVRRRLPVCAAPPRGPFDACPGWALAGPIRLIHLENTGNQLTWFRQSWQAALLSLVAVVLVLLYARWLVSAGPWGGAVVGMQLGGLSGNLLDHLRLGSAADFVNLSAQRTLNLADVWLIVGALLAVGLLVRAALRGSLDPPGT